jgi:hypothetical protein
MLQGTPVAGSFDTYVSTLNKGFESQAANFYFHSAAQIHENYNDVPTIGYGIAVIIRDGSLYTARPSRL